MSVFALELGLKLGLVCGFEFELAVLGKELVYVWVRVGVLVFVFVFSIIENMASISSSSLSAISLAISSSIPN